jgi:hypothetical protein
LCHYNIGALGIQAESDPAYRLEEDGHAFVAQLAAQSLDRGMQSGGIAEPGVAPRRAVQVLM